MPNVWRISYNGVKFLTGCLEYKISNFYQSNIIFS